MILKLLSAPETLEKVHERLGFVPLDRIRAKPAPGTATERDLERNVGPICELLDGTLVEKAVGTRESMLGLYIASLFQTHAEALDLGIALGGDGFIRLGEGLIRAPDATFIPWESLPDGELPEETFWTVVPGLIVELLSATNTEAEIDRKLRKFFAIGCKLAWVIDPRVKTAHVYNSTTRSKLLIETDTLDGGKVFPGFKLRLSHVLAVGRRRKPGPR